MDASTTETGLKAGEMGRESKSTPMAISIKGSLLVIKGKEKALCSMQMEAGFRGCGMMVIKLKKNGV